MSSEIGITVAEIPNFVLKVAQKLLDNGYQAYLVGGAVRDLILKRKVKDYDITTNALPEQIQHLFPKSVATGAKFGNIIVIAKDKYNESHEVDVTTFRKEENYFGGRWPSEVTFTPNIDEDLSRRDFTINAMALDFKIIIEDEDKFIPVTDLIDNHGGVGDITSGVIRAVGDPNERFSEDGIRGFRACRQASELGFSIEKETQKAITKNKNVSKMVSMERIRDEFNKLIYNSPTPSIGIKTLDRLDLLDIFLPELLTTKDTNQPEWHSDDVWEHSLKTLDNAEDSVKIAGLLHDIGKPSTITVDDKGTHFYGHDVKGAEMAEVILKRMRYSRSLVKEVKTLIRWHMFYYPSADWRKSNELTDKVEKENNYGWSDGAIRRFINNVGGVEMVKKLIKLRIADAEANTKTAFNPTEIEALETRISEVLQRDSALKISDLDISGNDLYEIGIPRDKNMGNILNKLLDLVLDKPELNSKQILLKEAKILYKNNAN